MNRVVKMPASATAEASGDPPTVSRNSSTVPGWNPDPVVVTRSPSSTADGLSSMAAVRPWAVTDAGRSARTTMETKRMRRMGALCADALRRDMVRAGGEGWGKP